MNFLVHILDFWDLKDVIYHKQSNQSFCVDCIPLGACP